MYHNNSARTELSSDEGMLAQFLFTNNVFAMLNKVLQSPWLSIILSE